MIPVTNGQQQPVNSMNPSVSVGGGIFQNWQSAAAGVGVGPSGVPNSILEFVDSPVASPQQHNLLLAASAAASVPSQEQIVITSPQNQVVVDGGWIVDSQ